MRKVVVGIRAYWPVISFLVSALLVILAILASVTGRDPYLVALMLAVATAIFGIASVDRRAMIIDRRALSIDRRSLSIDQSLRQIDTILRSAEGHARKASGADRAGRDDVLTAISRLHHASGVAEGRRRLDNAARERRVLELANRLDVRLTAIEKKDDVSELTALLNLFEVLPPQGIVTPPTDFSATPRTILALVAEVLSTPKDLLIVECGSGASTVWLAAACRHVSRGSVVALEHNAEYARETRQALERCGLSDFAEVRHAKLRPITLPDGSFRWYEAGGYAGIARIDVLFVDGPPGSSGSRARYPALPVLAPLLSEGSLVVMDDAARSDESDTVDQWLAARDLGGILTATSGAGRAVQMRWSRSQ